MSKLVEKYRVKYIPKDYWNGSNLKEMYVYGSASMEENMAMQEPLEKLYNYENSSDEYEALSRYLSKLEEKINYELGRMRDLAWGDPFVERLRGRESAFEEVQKDLKQLMADLKKQRSEITHGKI